MRCSFPFAQSATMAPCNPLFPTVSCDPVNCSKQQKRKHWCGQRRDCVLRSAELFRHLSPKEPLAPASGRLDIHTRACSWTCSHPGTAHALHHVVAACCSGTCKALHSRQRPANSRCLGCVTWLKCNLAALRFSAMSLQHSHLCVSKCRGTYCASSRWCA